MRVKSVCWLWTMIATSAVAAADTHRVNLEVSESTGVYRDGCPVHILLTLPHPATSAARFRLLHAGRPVVAQFRPHGPGPETSEWWLDFMAASAPYETRQYVVEYGPEVEAGPERTQGHTLIEESDALIVSNAPYINWTVPRDFRGLLRSVNFAPSEHLRPDSPGLTLVDRDGSPHLLGGEGTRVHIVRQGKLTVALRFEKAEVSEALQNVRWTADLVFPGPVSWVDVRLAIDDPDNRVQAASLQLQLNLDQPTGTRRTVVELGAARTIYRSLFGDEAVELRAAGDRDSPWQVLRGKRGQLQPFVVAAAGTSPAEGWAHVMDRERCLAIAFDRFGQDGEERLHVQADGTLTATKRFSAAESRAAAPKRWRSWLHFVHFPPQQSAATDPYMMQNSLLARQVD